jgi:uncharacterized delta-60 repeat protein
VQYLDSSFHYNGLQDSIVSRANSAQGGALTTLAVQADGKILATLELQGQIGLVRLNADGSLDASFATNGIFTVQSSVTGTVYVDQVVLQPDGKILLLGSASFPGQSRDVVLFRLLSDGSPDISFGLNGMVNTTSSVSIGSEDQGFNILLRPDGKIVVCGTTYVFGGGVNTHFHLLIQYKQDGSLDGTFGSGGIVLNNPVTSLSFYGTGGILQPDGKILVYGNLTGSTSNGAGLLARYEANGTPDAGFGIGGYLTTTTSNTGSGMVTDLQLQTAVQQSDGKIVMSFTGKKDTAFLKRLLPDGSVDVAFGDNGTFTYQTGNLNSKTLLTEMRVLAGDSLLVGGQSVAGQKRIDFTLLRVTPDGKLDSTWGINGRVVADFHGKDDLLYGIALQADGKILACGSSQENTAANPSIARFKANGRNVPAPPAPSSIFAGTKAAGTLRLYPNPTTNTVYLQGALAGDKVQVWNLMGQAVLVQTIATPELELSALPAGIYQVQLQRKDLVVGQAKLVKE